MRTNCIIKLSIFLPRVDIELTVQVAQLVAESSGYGIEMLYFGFLGLGFILRDRGSGLGAAGKLGVGRGHCSAG